MYGLFQNSSGGRYPGVPALLLNSFLLIVSEKPKSTILHSYVLGDYSIIFSSFISRCTNPYLIINLNITNA